MSFQIPKYHRSKNNSKQNTNYNKAKKYNNSKNNSSEKKYNNSEINSSENNSSEKKSNVQYMITDIKSYWSNSNVKDIYQDKTGEEAKDIIIEMIKNQSNSSTYVSYQIGRGKGIDIHYIYAANKETALSQMIYGFIKLANSRSEEQHV